MSKQCYAHALGDCDGKLSKEHIISSCTLDPVVKIVGSKKIPEKEISKDSAVAKILCQKHNSMLSPYDAEAKLLIEALSFASHAHRIGILESFREKPRVDTLNGDLLERWFLKTAINMAYTLNGNHKYIADKVLDYLFSDKKFEHPHGLHRVDYFEFIEEDEFKSIVCVPLIMESDHELGGFAFFIKGHPFNFWFPWLDKSRILEAKLISDVDIVQRIVGANNHWHCSQMDTYVAFPDAEICVQNIRFIYQDPLTV